MRAAFRESPPHNQPLGSDSLVVFARGVSPGTSPRRDAEPIWHRVGRGYIPALSF